MKYDRLIIFCDGGAVNNPGPAACGIVFYNREGKKILQLSKFLGIATNNQAEYRAVIFALETIKAKFKVKELQFYIDSKLIVEQLNGKYKLKNEGLKPLYNQVKLLQLNFPLVLFDHIRREKNRLADRLVKIEIKRNLTKR